MSDLISRQAAIDALDSIGSLDTDADREYARGVFNALPSAQQWIPCSEHLPEVEELVLVTDDSGGIKTVDVDRCGQYENSNERFWYYTQNAVAWMPLPEPYAEDEIQAMQDLEQAQLDKAYQIGVKEGLQSAQPKIEERTAEMAQNVPKDDLISRKAAIDAMGKAVWAKERLRELPSAQPERKKGKWNCGDDMFEYAICSACKWDSGEAWEYAKKYFRYCPHCGADMRGDNDA